MPRTLKALVLFLVLASAVTAARGEATVEDIIARVEKKCASIKDISSKFKMDMNIMGQKMSAAGDMKMELPNKMVLDMSAEAVTAGGNVAMKMKMVSDGKVMYQEMNTGGQVMVNKIDMEAAGMNVPGLGGMGGLGMGQMGTMNPNLAATIAELRKVMDIAVLPDATLGDGQKAWVIEGKFKPEYFRMMEGMEKTEGPNRAEVLKSQMNAMKLYIGQKDEFLSRMEFLANTGERTGLIEFTDLKFNEGLPADTFTYRVPEGVVVNDMTETMRRQAEAMKGLGEKPKGETGKTAADGGAATALRAGVQAPAFSVKTLSGAKFDLAAVRGKPVVVFFWAAWHKGSVAQLAELDQVREAQKDFQVIALSLDEVGEAEQVKEMLKAKGVTVAAAIGDDAIFDAYFVREIPTLVVIDAEGKVVSSESRPKDLSSLKKTIESLAKK